MQTGTPKFNRPFSGSGFDIFMKCAESTKSPSFFVKFNAKLPHFL